jgi:hypothetical protein
MSRKAVLWGLSTALIGMALGAAGTVALAKQGHMEEAYHHLQGAKEELQEADHDKGGHRDKALELINRAMQQVQAGMQYAHEHHEDTDSH